MQVRYPSYCIFLLYHCKGCKHSCSKWTKGRNVYNHLQKWEDVSEDLGKDTRDSMSRIPNGILVNLWKITWPYRKTEYKADKFMGLCTSLIWHESKCFQGGCDVTFNCLYLLFIFDSKQSFVLHSCLNIVCYTVCGTRRDGISVWQWLYPSLSCHTLGGDCRS